MRHHVVLCVCLLLGLATVVSAGEATGDLGERGNQGDKKAAELNKVPLLAAQNSAATANDQAKKSQVKKKANKSKAKKKISAKSKKAKRKKAARRRSLTLPERNWQRSQKQIEQGLQRIQ